MEVKVLKTGKEFKEEVIYNLRNENSMPHFVVWYDLLNMRWNMALGSGAFNSQTVREGLINVMEQGLAELKAIK